LNVSKSYRASSLHFKQIIRAHAPNPGRAIAHNPEIAVATTLVAQPNPTTYAGTTGNSETEPANAPLRAPISDRVIPTTTTNPTSLQTPGRKTPTADANGG